MLKVRELLIAGLSVLLVACSVNGGSDKSAAGSAAAHEQAIRKVNEQWLALIRDHDAAAVSKLYTAD